MSFIKLRNKLLVTVITTSRSGANETNNYLKYIGSGMGLLPISEIIFTHSSDIDELIHKINKSAYIINQYLIEKKKSIRINSGRNICNRKIR